MWTKNQRIICDSCGKFCVPYDEETPFGCSSYDLPEPLDPYHYCKKCSKELEKKWLKVLKDKNNWHCGYWQKSDAERKVAKKLGLVWVNSGGVGTLGSKNWADSYQYIPKKEYDRLSNLSYYGYCSVCGSKNSGGYCSNEKCENSFQNKNLLK